MIAWHPTRIYLSSVMYFDDDVETCADKMSVVSERGMNSCITFISECTSQTHASSKTPFDTVEHRMTG